jgi:ectoine hydroxylase-related dioxygenase (phytanoyl-CoA dioxygenase family)
MIDVDAYRRDGAVCVRGALGADEVAMASRGIDAVLADPSPLAIRASAAEDGAFVEDFCNGGRVPEFEALARTSRLAEMAGTLTGSRAIRLYHDHVLVKEPGTEQPTPWHQDLPYYDVEGTQNASVWIPVDPVPEASSLRIVAGSHVGPWFLPRTFLDGQPKWFAEGTLAELPDIESDPTRFPILAWGLEPGDVVFFHMLALHGTGGFAGPGRRRVLSLRFLGDDMVRTERLWRTSPPADAIGDTPVVWSATNGGG